MKLLLTALLIFGLTSTVKAQTAGILDISGITEVKTARGRISLKIAQLTNLGSPNYISGTIEFAVWATIRRYPGRGGIRGFKLLRCSIAGIPGGDGYSGVSCNAFLPLVPRGSYYITVVASEFDGGQFLIEDSVNLSKKFQL